MSKGKAFIWILITAPILGAIYGVIHDQVTYSISEEYYTKFKFIQFRIDSWNTAENIGTGKAPEIRLDSPRLGASVVGAMATWWVGLIAGILLALVGFLHRTGREMFRATFKAVTLTTVIALLIGLLGLAVGKFLLDGDSLGAYMPDNVIDRDSFVSVGMMHNFSYLGGGIGLLAAIFYSVKQRSNYLKQRI